MSDLESDMWEDARRAQRYEHSVVDKMYVEHALMKDAIEAVHRAKAFKMLPRTVQDRVLNVRSIYTPK